MATFTINSRKFGAQTFFMPSGGGYVRLESATKSGTLAPQIGEGGQFSGEMISTDPENFVSACRRWHRQRMAYVASLDGMTYQPW